MRTGRNARLANHAAQRERSAPAAGKRGLLLAGKRAPCDGLLGHAAIRPAYRGSGRQCRKKGVGIHLAARNIELHILPLDACDLERLDRHLRRHRAGKALDRTRGRKRPGNGGVKLVPGHRLIAYVAVGPGDGQGFRKLGSAAHPNLLGRRHIGIHGHGRQDGHLHRDVLAQGLHGTCDLERAALAALQHGKLLVGQGLPRHRLVGRRAARPQDAHRLGKHECVATGNHRNDGGALAQGRGHRDDLDLGAGHDLAGHNNLQRRRPRHKSTQGPKLATCDFADNLAVLDDLHRCLLKQLGRVDGNACGTAHGIARERRGGVDAQLDRLADRQGLRGDKLENEPVFLHVHALVDGTARRGGIRGAVHLLGSRVAKEADRVDFLVGKHDGRHAHGLGLVGHGVGIVARGVVHRALGAIPVCLRLHVPGVKRALYAREV